MTRGNQRRALCLCRDSICSCNVDFPKTSSTSVARFAQTTPRSVPAKAHDLFIQHGERAARETKRQGDHGGGREGHRDVVVTARHSGTLCVLVSSRGKIFPPVGLLQLVRADVSMIETMIVRESDVRPLVYHKTSAPCPTHEGIRASALYFFFSLGS